MPVTDDLHLPVRIARINHPAIATAHRVRRRTTRGRCDLGNIGTGNRLEFTVIGEAANLAAGIESMCKSLGEPVLLSAEFAAYAPDRSVSLGAQELKGIDEPQEIYALRKI